MQAFEGALQHSPKEVQLAPVNHHLDMNHPLVVVNGTEVWRGRQKMRRRVGEVDDGPAKRCKKPPKRQDPYGTLHANWLLAREGKEGACCPHRHGTPEYAQPPPTLSNVARPAALSPLPPTNASPPPLSLPPPHSPTD